MARAMVLLVTIIVHLAVLTLPNGITANPSDIFSKDHSCVRFSPNIHPQDYGFSNNESQLINMISTISLTFRKILSPLIEIKKLNLSLNYNAAMIPNATAIFNKHQQSNNKSATELIMTFHLFDTNNHIAGFSAIKKIADEANLVHPKTVTTLSISETSYHFVEPEEVRKRVEIVRGSLVGDTNNHYKLVTFIPGSVCGFPNIQKLMTLIFPYLDEIYFRIFPTLEDGVVQLGANATANWALRSLQNCSSVIEHLPSYSPHSVGLMTIWPHFQLNERSAAETESTGLVRYWTQLAKWAKDNNRQLILWQAFDTFKEADPTHQQTGWWKLAPNQTETNPLKQVFVSKAQLEEMERRKDDTGQVSSSPWVLISFGILGIIVVVFGGGAVAQTILAKRVSPVGKEEVERFFHGNTNDVELDEFESNVNIYSARLPYKAELEVGSEDFLIEGLLGSGAFGIVHQGILLRHGERSKVAIKTTNSLNCLKGLMDEIKIMSHVGDHDNIVVILGANTAELAAKGKLFLLTELCSLGSLVTYLRNNRSKYIAKQVQAESPDGCLGQENSDVITEQNLKQWTFEIANGMEFLSTKKVIHGDLAARNILLTSNGTAKISDFGLSTRLDYYQDYVRIEQQDKMPWKWMAPEALRDLKLSESSDVWSFGVTIWEIYSLGEIPYGGLKWTADFTTRLEEGLRLEKPCYDFDDMYSDWMTKCWMTEPGIRPTFSSIRNGLAGCRDADYVELGPPAHY